MYWRKLIILLSLALFTVLAAADVTGQEVNARLSGRVVDAAGIPVSSATIELVNQETGLRKTTETGTPGRYGFPFITPGVYTITAGAPGYQTEERMLDLHVGTRIEVDFTLLRMYELEGQVVEAERQRESLTNYSVSYVVEEEEIDNLPYRRREYQNLAILAPGVKRGSVAGIEVFDLDILSIAGRDGSNVAFSADGAQNNDYSVGIPAIEFPQEAIEEFQVGTHRFGAEHGGSAAGYINVLTKSGTNTWRGSFFTYLRTESLMARDYFMRSYGSEKPGLTMSQFGASLGGPIVENRTHLFTAYEGTRGEDAFLTVHTGGAFPDEDLSFARPVREDLFHLKVNHSFSPKHDLMVRYNQQNSTMELLDTGGSWTAGSSRMEDIDKYMLLGKHNWYRSPGFSTQVTGYYAWLNRYSVPRNPNDPVMQFPSAFLGSNMYSPYDHSAHQFGLSGAAFLSAIGPGSRHNLKAGIEYQRINSTFMVNRLGSGLFYYVDDDIQSIPVLFLVNLGDSLIDSRRNITSVFFEDDWFATDRLKLLLGVRYDLETGILTDYDKTPAARFIRNNYEDLQDIFQTHFPELGLSNGYTTLQADIDNVAPRLGMTFDLTGNGKLMIRGGYGIYYDSVYELVVRGITRQNSDRPQLELVIPMPGFTPDSIPDLTERYDPSGRESNLGFLSPRLETPYTHQSSIGISFSPRKDVSLQVDYVNSIGRNELRQRDINFVTESGRFLSDDFESIIVSESIGTSRYDALLFQFDSRFSSSLKTRISYTLSHTNNSQDGVYTRPQDSLRPLAEVEYGPSRLDATHNVGVSVLTDFPRVFEINSFMLIESPRPYSILTGTDDNGDGIRNDRPVGLKRNSERGAWTFQWDMRISRSFHFGTWGTTELLVDFLNITNRANFGKNFINVLTSESFGQPNGLVTPPRHVQIGLRHVF